MTDFFYNRAGRLRSVWRLAVFTAAYLAAVTAAFAATDLVQALILPRETYRWLVAESGWNWVIQSVKLFVPAALIGWGCVYVLEELPWRSLGWSLHRGWLRDTLFGLLVGGASVCLAALIGGGFGGYSFAFNDGVAGAALLRTVVVSGVVFLLGAAAEEMLFRGYPFQTLLRSWPLWAALVPVSVPFALVHLTNPNVAPVFTFANTVLAGVWLGVAYWRTRSLWFPLGVHAGWNWVQGAALGSPVSGITKITPDPLLRMADAGPHWLGGGAYGIEGGAACTLALLLSTIFIWRTRLLAATPELRQYTDGENPNSETGGAPAPLNLL
ncbi:MAG: CPBP family intramembrane metalloprotease [Acidobacteria bacterium]|nr:CPBP family intramembrane metalloprotease [Acidobacteriota bacterium]